MPTRTAHTAWEGTLESGTGEVQLVSSDAGTFEVSFPRRSAEDSGGVTSPEELIAAAHTSCYAMQMSALLAKHARRPARSRSPRTSSSARTPRGSRSAPST